MNNDFATGFPTFLKLWLFFLLAFVFLGYSIPLSIGLGAIAGLAGGFTNAWLKSKDEPSKAPPDEPSILEEKSTKLGGLRKAMQQRNMNKNSNSLLKPGWLFGKKTGGSKSRHP